MWHIYSSSGAKGNRPKNDFYLHACFVLALQASHSSESVRVEIDALRELQAVQGIRMIKLYTMKKSIRVNMPTDVLWEFRKFKRGTPAEITSFINSYGIEDNPEYVNGKDEFGPVELSIVGNQALLTNGNHRIAIAKRLGLKMIPVHLVVFFGACPFPFDDNTLNRFKPVSRHLELWLKRFFTYNFNQASPVIDAHELWFRLKFNQHFNLN